MNCKVVNFFIIALLMFVFGSHSFAQDSTGFQTDTPYATIDEDSIDDVVAGDTAIIKTAFDIGDDSLQ